MEIWWWTRGERLDWYRGPTLLEILEAAPAAHSEAAEPFRFPVQYVCRPQAADDPELHDFRGYMGRVESGTIAVGDEIRVLPSGGTARIKEIRTGEQQYRRRRHDPVGGPASIGVVLQDIARVSIRI